MGCGDDNGFHRTLNMGLWNHTSLGEAFLLRIHRGSGFVATHNQTVANLCKAVRWSGKRPPTSPISIRPSERGHINFTIQVCTRSTDHEELVLAWAVMIASGILVCQCHVVLLSRRDVGGGAAGSSPSPRLGACHLYFRHHSPELACCLSWIFRVYRRTSWMPRTLGMSQPILDSSHCTQ